METLGRDYPQHISSGSPDAVNALISKGRPYYALFSVKFSVEAVEMPLAALIKEESGAFAFNRI